MSEFAKYEQLHTQGASPQEIHAAAKSDGLDEIACLRLLRQVCGLSLGEAKEVATGGDVLSDVQPVEPGGTVYWEGWTSTDGAYLMQARVRDVQQGIALLENHRKFRVTAEGLREVPPDAPPMEEIPAARLKKPLGNRLVELMAFLDELAHINHEAV